MHFDLGLKWNPTEKHFSVGFRLPFRLHLVPGNCHIWQDFHVHSLKWPLCPVNNVLSLWGGLLKTCHIWQVLPPVICWSQILLALIAHGLEGFRVVANTLWLLSSPEWGSRRLVSDTTHAVSIYFGGRLWVIRERLVGRRRCALCFITSAHSPFQIAIRHGGSNVRVHWCI